jgi:outer membrane lipoprotein-sorting protein
MPLLIGTMLALTLLPGTSFAADNTATVTAASAGTESADVSRARKILEEIDDLWRGSSSHAVMTMQVKTTHYTRSMRMEAWSKGKEKTLVRILSPLREKGTATLKSGNTIYTYLPRTDRTILLTSGMMMGSWMGSHFTNDDLVKESRMADDYNPRITFEGMRDGHDIMVFEMLPRPNAAVVWGKLTMVVEKDGLIPMSETYYDEDMEVARTMTFSDVKELAGRRRPAVMKMVPADKPDEFTEITYEQLQLNVPLSDNFFSLASLRRF